MPFALLAFYLVLPILAVLKTAGGIEPWIIVAGCALPSLIGFALIADDKRRAKASDRRTPESTLHLVELLGGWPGSYLAQQRYRHKTVKRSYRRTFWFIVLLHQGIAVEALRDWPLLRALLASVLDA